MNTKFERMVLLKARTGKASKAWLKQAATMPLSERSELVLDTAFPGWVIGRGVALEDLSIIDDMVLAFDLHGATGLDEDLAEQLHRWISSAEAGTLSEELWRHLDLTIPGWAPTLGKRVAALRLRACQAAGFRCATGRDPLVNSKDAFERSLAGWLRRNRAKHRANTMPSRDAQIISSRVDSWLQKLA